MSELLDRIAELEKQLAELKELAEVTNVNINFADIRNDLVSCCFGTVLTVHKDAKIIYECWEANTGLLTGQLVVNDHGVQYGYDIDTKTVEKIGLPTDKQYNVTRKGDNVFFDAVE